MEEPDDFIYCTLCNYKVKKERKDNFDRHMKTHYRSSVSCDCGKEMSMTSLTRHKKKFCPLKSEHKTAPQKMKQQNVFTCACGAKMSKTSVSRHIKSACPKTNSSFRNVLPPNKLVKSTTHKIETIVRTDVYSDGKVVVTHDEINSGKMYFTINASIHNEHEPAEFDSNAVADSLLYNTLEEECLVGPLDCMLDWNESTNDDHKQE